MPDGVTHPRFPDVGKLNMRDTRNASAPSRRRENEYPLRRWQEALEEEGRRALATRGSRGRHLAELARRRPCFAHAFAALVAPGGRISPAMRAGRSGRP
jgi:hypothetical protein